MTDSDVVTAPQLEVTEAGEQLRALTTEAQERGAPMVSALTMQRRLFDIYDLAAVSDEALGLVQHHLTLTINRNWFSPSEISDLADQVDWALTVGSAPASADAPAPEPVA